MAWCAHGRTAGSVRCLRAEANAWDELHLVRLPSFGKRKTLHPDAKAAASRLVRQSHCPAPSVPFAPAAPATAAGHLNTG